MNKKDNYRYEEYEKVLTLVLQAASKDYWAQYIDVNRHQAKIAKTYLWVSAALIGSYFACARFLLTSTLHTAFHIYLYGALAVFFSILAFGVCLYGLPSRGGYKKIGMGSWGTYSKLAYDSLFLKEEGLYRNVLVKLVDDFDDAVVYNTATNSKKAKWLRHTSNFLLASFSFAVLTFFMVSMENLDYRNTLTLGDEQKTASQGQKEATIKPKGSIKESPSNIFTHDAVASERAGVEKKGEGIDKFFLEKLDFQRTQTMKNDAKTASQEQEETTNKSKALPSKGPKALPPKGPIKGSPSKVFTYDAAASDGLGVEKKAKQ